MHRAEGTVRTDPADRRGGQVHNVPRKLGGVGQTDQVEERGRNAARPDANQIDAPDELRLRQVHGRIPEKRKRNEKARGGVKSAIP